MGREIRMTPRARTMNQRIVRRTNRPPKLRKRTRPHQLRTTVLSLIPGTYGLWSELARRLGCAISTVQRILKQEGWEWVREAFEEERLRTKDRCARTLYNLALHSPADGIRFAAAKEVCEKTHPDFQPRKKVTIEGGDNPIKVQAVMFNVPVEILQASVGDRLKLLEMLDEVENAGS